MSEKIIATIQARMGSERLPGKVLKDICGKPMILRQIERLKNSRLIDNIIVATTTSPKDDILEEFCLKNSIQYFRGSEDDVLQRICDTLEKYNKDIHIELHGDSPLVDYQIIDEFIGLFLKNKNSIDFLSNNLKTTYPPGMEFSIYHSKILLELNKIIKKDDKLREHVGFNITRFKDKYTLKSVEAISRHYNPEIYLEVDSQEDLMVVRKVFEYFIAKEIEYFGIDAITEMLLKNKEIAEINNKVERRWKSLRNV